MTATSADVLRRFSSLRQHQRDGTRSPHKPLLVLLALGRLQSTGSSAVPWSVAETQLAELIAEFGPASRTSPAQSAAYPFTRLRTDAVWQLDRDVVMDSVGPLRREGVTGAFVPDIEKHLLSTPAAVAGLARLLVDSQFPATISDDVLTAAGLAELVETSILPPSTPRRRDSTWRMSVVDAWDRQCAFCGYDGQVAGVPVGLEAAHVRWFAFDGPDDLDNGLALCMLHHKLFDRGILGLDDSHQVTVSGSFTARTEAGRQVYGLHGRPLSARPGTPLPAPVHVAWHTDQVFKGAALAA
ncbi:phosphorothioated DNA-binding restriction endonuclease [Klenkia sp. PcliD-1-E]|uniref:phosphorothioated DNA-binding restriction endonuclease n=1 Tax=Klenkia sp. PcliD-1-E TaxID=2954492 RepID=UPI0020978004|nr:HNH endonuclease [Klenkia sp. PcliD-1-E]MCO7218483.1 HNH endonuclease [Klenkia sp. PcliD-1-E]